MATSVATRIFSAESHVRSQTGTSGPCESDRDHSVRREGRTEQSICRPATLRGRRNRPAGVRPRFLRLVCLLKQTSASVVLHSTVGHRPARRRGVHIATAGQEAGRQRCRGCRGAEGPKCAVGRIDPNQLAISPDGARVYVANEASAHWVTRSRLWTNYPRRHQRFVRNFAERAICR